MVLGMGVRLFWLGRWSFWPDEIFSFGARADGFNDSVLLRSLATDLIAWTVRVLGPSEWNARLDLSKIAFVGIDALPTPDGGIKSVMDGRLTVTYVYPTGGAQAIDWARRILEDKEEPPKTVVLETEQVDSTNAADLYTKYGGK